MWLFHFFKVHFTSEYTHSSDGLSVSPLSLEILSATFCVSSAWTYKHTNISMDYKNHSTVFVLVRNILNVIFCLIICRLDHRIIFLFIRNAFAYAKILPDHSNRLVCQICTIQQNNELKTNIAFEFKYS